MEFTKKRNANNPPKLSPELEEARYKLMCEPLQSNSFISPRMIYDKDRIGAEKITKALKKPSTTNK